MLAFVVDAYGGPELRQLEREPVVWLALLEELEPANAEAAETDYALSARTAGWSSGVGTRTALDGTVITATPGPQAIPLGVTGQNHVAVQVQGQPPYLGYFVTPSRRRTRAVRAVNGR